MFDIFNKLKPKQPTNDITGGKWQDVLSRGIVSIKDIIAPPAIEVDFDFIKIGSTFYRTLFVVGYPRYVQANWLSSLINFEHSLIIAMYQ